MRNIFLTLCVMFSLTACLEQPDAAQDHSARATQERAATEAANSVTFTANAEIENIKKRLQLTSDPTLLGYIVLFNQAGQPILYEGAIGKVTSGNKRLNRVDQVQSISTFGNNGGQHSVVRQAPSDEGTHGSSSPYIFYWNQDGVYRQWSDQYLYSDKPMRLRVEPVVISIAPAKP